MAGTSGMTSRTHGSFILAKGTPAYSINAIAISKTATANEA
jgi:hypothetical protein